MFSPSMKYTYFCETILILLLVSLTRGDNCIRNRLYGPIFLAKFRRFYGRDTWQQLTILIHCFMYMSQNINSSKLGSQTKVLQSKDRPVISWDTKKVIYSVYKKSLISWDKEASVSLFIKQLTWQNNSKIIFNQATTRSTKAMLSVSWKSTLLYVCDKIDSRPGDSVFSVA